MSSRTRAGRKRNADEFEHSAKVLRSGRRVRKALVEIQNEPEEEQTETVPESSEMTKIKKELRMKVVELERAKKSEAELRKSNQELRAQKKKMSRKVTEHRQEVRMEEKKNEQNVKELKEEFRSKIYHLESEIERLGWKLEAELEKLQAQKKMTSNANKEIETLLKIVEEMREALENGGQVKKTFECAVCREMFLSNVRGRVARILKCGHTFCNDCIEKQLYDDGIECPFDFILSQCETTSDFPKNYMVM